VKLARHFQSHSARRWAASIPLNSNHTPKHAANIGMANIMQINSQPGIAGRVTEKTLARTLVADIR